jgi:imidazolonepropionase
MKTIIKNIKGLVGVDNKNHQWLAGDQMDQLNVIENAYLAIENDKIVDYGNMDELAIDDWRELKVYDAEGRFVLPTYVDSHTHIVWAGNREGEFVDRIHGMTYEEIALKGGGIINSAKKLQETSEEVLYENAKKRIEEVMDLGTGAIEIKSGYGLKVEAELKMLRVIKKLKENLPITIKPTFLGAHAFPPEFKDDHAGYINLIIDEMLPLVAKENLAEYLDVFCETGYFSVEETNKLMQAGQQYGLTPKIHVNQFTAIGGVKAAVDQNALSVDHLEEMNPDDFEILADSKTMPVVLPSCSFFLSIPYAPARKMIDYGLPVAIATDYNPGSTPSGNMQLAVAIASIKMKLTPEEAINAATINGAYAMGLSESHGSISVGKHASFFITKEIPSYSFMPYSFGSDHIDTVFINGEIVRRGKVIED